MFRFISIPLFLIIVSCGDIEFVYDKEKTTNPLYEKTDIRISGVDLPYSKSYLPMFFGKNKKEEFILLVKIEEKKIKRSVKTNQATSNLTYDLRFLYLVKSKIQNCEVFKKEILSSFSINPKSSGYNYGTDISLEKKYELAITDNLNEFVSSIIEVDLNECR